MLRSFLPSTRKRRVPFEPSTKSPVDVSVEEVNEANLTKCAGTACSLIANLHNRALQCFELCYDCVRSTG